MKKDVMLGNERIEDVRWLCSLSNSELDLVISLKKMATQRNSVILKKTSHKFLSKNLNLKMLRDLTFVIMQVVKERLDGVTPVVASGIDRSNVIKHEISDEFRDMGVEELMAYILPDKKKRISKLFGIDDTVTKKKKSITIDC
ncbi:hypothetical protein SSX86_024874 [Deinandra increscens subsp. villosa]|uniref:Uncharacterized protein n=1 Tax=Deinandra increscens subsp. villosa TaxID=3103831 RepID=A0AAP0CCB0_9ASTR